MKEGVSQAGAISRRRSDRKRGQSGDPRLGNAAQVRCTLTPNAARATWRPHQPLFTACRSAAPRDPSLHHAAAADPTAWPYFLSRSASAMNRMPKTME
jgi:hypothetical protein